MRVVAWIGMTLLLVSGRAAGSSRIHLDLHPYAGQIELSYVGTRVAVYQFQSDSHRPGIRELNTLLGVPVLLDSPENPPQHRGGSLVLRLQGMSFGEETEGAGWQQGGAELSRHLTRDPQGRWVAEIDHTVYWLPAKSPFPKADEAWLVESRRVRFLVDEATGEVAVDWLSEFEVGRAVGSLVLEVPEEQGFVLRLAPGLEGVGVQPTASAASEAEKPTGRVSPNPWISVIGEANGRPVSVAVFGDSDQVGALHGFTRLDPSALLGMRPRMEGLPRLFQTGDRFAWRHLVIVQSRLMSPESLEARRLEWLHPQR